MRTKELKVLMEGFNKFLINEHTQHSYNADRLLKKITNDFPEFEPYVNDDMQWYPADEWILGIDDVPSEIEKLEKFYKEIAKECGCELKDLLVSSTEDLDIDSNGHSLENVSFKKNNKKKCGTFTINGQTLKGFAGIETYVVAPMCGVSQGSTDSSSDEIGVETSSDDRFGDVLDGEAWDLNEEEHLDEGRKFDL